MESGRLNVEPFFRLVSGRVRRSPRISEPTRRRSSRLCRRKCSSRTYTRRSTPCTPCRQRYVIPWFSVYTCAERCLQCGTVGEQGVILPPPLPLTSERLERHGLFLIEDGQTIFLWVGRDAVPQLIMDVFNLPNYEVLRGGKVSLLTASSPSHRLTVFRPRRRCPCSRTSSRSA